MVLESDNGAINHILFFARVPEKVAPPLFKREDLHNSFHSRRCQKSLSSLVCRVLTCEIQFFSPRLWDARKAGGGGCLVIGVSGGEVLVGHAINVSDVGSRMFEAFGHTNF
ncbi:hypothetical protein CDAR_232241 [Caerostris darwini]|uniref:Uncharacterized protein n=1 Tax=Caerostris darwini TaxID=1538125 RepID=A0AAV4UMI5_9ARAC|nr:hypothetical protein CDAR_232241 [Caerostris darwini]